MKRNIVAAMIEVEAEARGAVLRSVTSAKTKVLTQIPSKETTMKKLVLFLK